MLHDLFLQIKPEANIQHDREGILLSNSFDQHYFQKISDNMVDLLVKWQAFPIVENTLIDVFIGLEGMEKLPYFVFLINQLKQKGLIIFSVENGPLSGLKIEPLAGPFELDTSSILIDKKYRISEFAYIRTENGLMFIQSPKGLAKVSLSNPLILQIVGALGKWHTIDTLATLFPNINSIEVKCILSFLNAASTLADDEELNHKNTWEFHDMLFHNRSRLGKHHSAYGGTFRFQDKFPSPPAVIHKESKTIVDLNTPSQQLLDSAPSLWNILNLRRSIRSYNDEVPINKEQLSNFLYFTSRIDAITPTEHGDFSHKPYPSGGGLYELEVYPLVKNCGGIDPGLYHYDSLEHQLRLVSTETPATNKLSNMAYFTAGQEGLPQVVLIISARFQRVNWKYQSVAYALILKHVGVLYQSMYLTATALGLAPCALGGGDSALFAEIAKLNEWEEGSVGEFMLGSQPLKKNY